MKIIQADRNDILELYRLQLLAFESEAEMIGSRDVPALQEAEEENARDFSSQINIRLYEKMGYKIRESQTKKIPYTLVLGNNERDNNTITYRMFGKENSTTIERDKFIDMIIKQVEEYK